MISNPINPYVNGSEKSSFTYEGGSTLYHFSPKDNEISDVRDWNVVFFANSEEHAFDVLRRALEHIIECEDRFKRYVEDEGNEWAECHSRRMGKAQKYLSHLVNGEIGVQVAPKNQFYRVGWSYNDTL